MRVLTGILVVAALVIPMSSQGQSAASKADIQKLLQEQDDARHGGDWNAFGQFFTAEATTLSSDGTSYKGRAQIQSGNQDQWGAGVYKGARIKRTVESVEVIAPDVVLADITFEITNIAGGGNRTGRTAVVLVRSNNAWKVAATRSMVPTAAGALKTSP